MASSAADKFNLRWIRMVMVRCARAQWRWQTEQFPITGTGRVSEMKPADHLNADEIISN